MLPGVQTDYYYESIQCFTRYWANILKIGSPTLAQHRPTHTMFAGYPVYYIEISDGGYPGCKRITIMNRSNVGHVIGPTF